MTLLYLALAYLLGLVLGKWVWQVGLLGCDLPIWLWWVPSALLLFVPLLHRWERGRWTAPNPPLRWPASAGFMPPPPPLSLALATGLLLCLLIGILRYAAHPLTPCWTSSDLAYYNLPASRAFDRQAEEVTLEGYISAYPMREDGRHRLHVTVESIMDGDAMRPVRGVLLLQHDASGGFVYGQPLRLTGRLVTPPDFEDFSYREYLARSGVHSILYDAKIEQLATPLRGGWWHYLYSVRMRGERLINRSLPEPYAALANGMLLGIDSGISDDVYDAFNSAGISHILVISGSNVALIAAIAIALSRRLVGPRRAVYPALAAIAVYAVLVGGEAAVLRAALMGGLVVFAGSVKRRSTALISLAVAAASLTLVNPLALWDVGFQLSTMATAGLILFTTPITAWLNSIIPGFQGGVLTSAVSRPAANLLRGLFADALVVTLAANVMVLPLLVFYFGRLSHISIAANLLVAAVQPLILLCGTLGLLIGVAGLPLVALPFLWVVWLGLYWSTFVALMAAQMPGANLYIGGFGWQRLAITYLVIFAVRFWNPHWFRLEQLRGWQRGLGRLHHLQPLWLGLLALAAALVWGAVATLPDGRLHLYFLDAGEGAAVLIQTPAGRLILVGGARIPQRVVSEIGEVMPFWDRSLDLMVMTQPQGGYAEMMAQIPLRLPVEHFVAGADGAVSSGDGWESRLRWTDTRVTTLAHGGWIDMGDSVALWSLPPMEDAALRGDPAAPHSMALKVRYDDFGLLIAAGGAWLGEKGLLSANNLIQPGTAGRVHLATDGQTVWVERSGERWYLEPGAEEFLLQR